MGAEELYLILISIYSGILGFLVPKYLYKIKFLPIGHLAIGGIGALAATIFHSNVMMGFWNEPLVGLFYATFIIIALAGVLFLMGIGKNKEKTEKLTTSKNLEPSLDVMKIKTLIGENEIESACEQLIDYTFNNGFRKKKNELILLKGKIEKLKSENRMGVISNEQKDIGYSKISYSLLEIADSLR